MLTALIVLALTVAASTLGMLAMVASAIRAERPHTELSSQAPNPVAAVVRRLLGMYVCKSAADPRREACLTERATGRREGW